METKLTISKESLNRFNKNQNNHARRGIMGEEYEPETGTTFYRVDKRTAENMFNRGYCVYLLPYKININSMWIKPAPVRRCVGGEITNDWNKTLNQFIYYCCNTETGRYPKYFVTVDSYIGYNLTNAIAGGDNQLTTK